MADDAVTGDGYTRHAVLRGTLFLMLALPQAPARSVDSGADFDSVATTIFWSGVYPEGDATLYCGYSFGSDRRTPAGQMVGLDHIYTTDSIIRFLGCESRMQCREEQARRFAAMEADMHNIYPDWQLLTTLRNGREFGLIDGEEWRLEDCDIEWRAGVIEPREIARGNIARAMLYMHATYGLPIAPAQWPLLRNWNRSDPPSRQEILRNDRIEKLQGRRNPFIDEPALADKLKPVAH